MICDANCTRTDDELRLAAVRSLGSMSDGVVLELGVTVLSGIGFSSVDDAGFTASGDAAGMLVCSNVLCVAAGGAAGLAAETPQDEQPDAGAV
jgi:hypothetical protein